MVAQQDALCCEDGRHLGEVPRRRLDGRSHERKNLFVAAVLYCDGGCSPAKIRNLSESGALIEAAVVPPPGTRIRLRRGSLEVGAKVVWQKRSSAGVKFDAAVCVVDWLPTAKNAHQTAVDQMVHQVRMADRSDLPHATETRSAPGEAAQEIRATADMLEQIAERLAADSRVVVAHGDRLQQLDLAVQRLRRLSI